MTKEQVLEWLIKFGKDWVHGETLNIQMPQLSPSARFNYSKAGWLHYRDIMKVKGTTSHYMLTPKALDLLND